MDDVLKGEAGAAVLLFYLFPGFLGSLVYDFLVEGRKRENFERIIAAVVLTLVSAIGLNVALGVSLIPPRLGKDAPLADIINAFLGRNLLYASLISLGIVVILAYVNNSGLLYGFLKLILLTNKKSNADVWSDVFDEFQGRWVRVHFDGGRSLVGWPKFYSKSGEAREIFLADASWWDLDTNGAVVQTEVAGPGVYLSDFAKVTSIELLKGG